MRSFAVIAGLAASVQAAAVYNEYPAYNVSSAVETPVYEATTSIPAYETSSAPAYETTIHTIDCPKPTTIVYGHSSIVVSSSTVLTYTEITVPTKTPEAVKPTTEAAKPTTEAAKPTSEAAKPTSEYAQVPPPVHTPAMPYPSSNGTHPTAVYPTASAPPAKPTTTSPSQFTGAASSLNVAGFVAGVGAVAAFFL